ncbi:MAG: glycoside hydrolase family 127 protein [Fimbriimonas sp.]
MTLRRRMRSLPLAQIRLTDPLWARYQRILLETTLPHEYAQLVETGRLANFHRAAKGEGEFEGRFWFNDSDVYKFIEACAYALAVGRSAAVQRQMDECIEAVVAAQEPSGYINTFFQLGHPDLKWRNLNTMHEMYCGGHLIEAGVALYESLGDRRLLDVSVRFADHVMSVFGPEGRRGYCGHQEIELALLRLAQATGQAKYREYARWMVEERGKHPSPFEAELDDAESMKLSPGARHMLMKGDRYSGEYAQDHAPIREHTEIVGHAVRAMYFYIAAADLADGQEDRDLEIALERIWNNLTKKRMYVTGGIGPSASNEGFTGDYDLPNLTAYAETCAAIGLVFWGHRMVEMTGSSEYVDVLERALYNGVLSGINLAGDRFFYTNPLESRGTHDRTPWFTCACCPPNIARLIGSLGGYALGVGEASVYLHLPVAMEAEFEVDGVPVKLTVEGTYPWNGQVAVRVAPQRPVTFALNVRIPGWADDVQAEIEGAEEEAGYDQGYAVFERQWQAGDVLKLDFEMHPKWVESDPRVRDNLGRAALTMGPVVYCAEAHDLGYAPQLFTADTEAEVGVEFRPKLLEGVNVLSVEGVQDVELFVDDLYAEFGTTDAREATAEFIPYFAWNNRGATNMQVWTRRL